jgi:hypothetical protein
MTKPANWCDECKHFLVKDENYKDVCDLKHKPRFYEPKTFSQVHMGVWGWKRKCKDFARGET